ncbi:hypothetical protein EHS25_005253 [Saitozyma podzolica]|uniref:Myb-like domain-containing protein n=1 Tax=Saitozyma podzolica TaxID=1890683 RepID=A0A427XYP5_9TREE|nr:hypothetical protein EHS25_005253 [Saitozyma podzolica]
MSTKHQSNEIMPFRPASSLMETPIKRERSSSLAFPSDSTTTTPMTPMTPTAPAPSSAPKKSKGTTPSSHSKVKTKGETRTTKTTPKGGGGGDGWTPQRRIKLFEAYQEVAAVKWGGCRREGITGKQCREQWQRATGKRIRNALAED